MKKFSQWCFALLAVALLASACVPAAVTPTSQSVFFGPTPTLANTPQETLATATPTVEPTATLIPLTLGLLRNISYFLPASQKTVRLQDGSYQAGSGADYLSVKMEDAFALGDLNGDTIPDAAVILAENMGGSGTFVSLVVELYQDGKPAQLAMEIGDRDQVKVVSIKDQLLTLDMVIHGPNDPMCCPSLPTTETYILTKLGLILTHSITKTPDGAERSITISSPASGTQVGDSVTVKGGVTIAPFENSLAYRLYDLSGNQVAEGSVNVTADQAGNPGTFEGAVDLSKVAPGAGFRLAILDLSAADGSILAMDSVALTRK